MTERRGVDVEIETQQREFEPPAAMVEELDDRSTHLVARADEHA
ncbi:hypothetical protein ACFWY5_40915 [Nonomuraea sp. NPDC059007]